MKAKKSKGKRAAKHAAKDLMLKSARSVRGGKPQKADGSLDAGLHFKYDIKGNKEG